jgi:hypothetical protein
MPETLVGMLLYLLGAFAAGWAFAARALGNEGGPGDALSVPLLRMARFSYLGSLLMAAVMMGNA